MSILHASAAPVRSGLFARIAEAFHNARAASAQRVIYRQTLRELRSLSDHDLKDLGIDPHNIEAVAYEAVYQK